MQFSSLEAALLGLLISWKSKDSLSECPSTEDRRTVWLTLTEAGHQKLREVWPDHRESIYLYFGQYLDTQDAETIRGATEKVFQNYHE